MSARNARGWTGGTFRGTLVMEVMIEVLPVRPTEQEQCPGNESAHQDVGIKDGAVTVFISLVLILYRE